ncbi:MAG: lytic transglycosylase domain-containing protein [Salinibacter sp.]
MKRFQQITLAVFLLGTVGAVATVHGQSAPKDYVRRMAQRTAPKAPAVSTRKRLQRYESYIRYFSGLVYTRAGVTVNANFVRALIAAESGARPQAVSEDGAIGLLQIRPETGRRAAQKLYTTGYDFRYVRRRTLRTLTAEDLKAPAVNILIGCYLLDRYNAAFGGHLARTVGAWNAGPDRVRQYQGTPPYEETLGLIARVNAFYLFFRRR